MELIPIKTRALHPPKDDLYEVINESLVDVRERDIILITSKIVSIHEGRCVPIQGTDKEALIEKEAEHVYHVPETGRILTVTRSACISSSGIDESNADGHYVLLPEDAYRTAKEIWEYLTKKHSITELGVVITDSHSTALRYGAVSISIGCWGFVPVEQHMGKKDIFGRTIQYAKTNIVDALAAATTLVSGECAEATPIVIARNVPTITFADIDPRQSLLVPLEQDLYKTLFDAFEKGGRSAD